MWSFIFRIAEDGDSTVEKLGVNIVGALFIGLVEGAIIGGWVLR